MSGCQFRFVSRRFSAVLRRNFPLLIDLNSHDPRQSLPKRCFSAGPALHANITEGYIMANFPHPRPKLIVFDLDRTLWPFWVDTHVDPPFTKNSKGVLYDRYGKKVDHFPDAPSILERISQEGIPIAAASRTGEIDGAEQLLELWDWNKYFTYKEIYPGCKVTHFNRFKKLSGIKFQDMLFFDDEYRNIVDINKLGVTCIYAEQGMSHQVLQEGLLEFARKHQ